MKKNIRHQTILKMIRDENRLISTNALAVDFGVSEATIRRDLLELSKAGQLQRQYGGAVSTDQQYVNQDKGQIGLLLGSRIDRFSDPFFNLVLEGAERKLQEMGYRSAYVKTSYDVRTQKQAEELITHFPTHGIVLLGSNTHTSIQYIRERSPFTVTVTDTIVRDGTAYNDDIIMFDGKGGIIAIVKHLMERGYKRLGYITGKVDQRYIGFVSATETYQLPTDNDLICVVPKGVEGWTPQIGGQGAKELMSLDNPPDAIVCASDRLAIGAMQWLHQNGYRIPQDIAVTGLDNIPESDFTFPRLTTVHVHKELLGELAVERVVRRIENPNEIPLRIITPTSLVIRQSCGSE
jgi:LacI family transcriptional regulator